MTSVGTRAHAPKRTSPTPDQTPGQRLVRQVKHRLAFGILTATVDGAVTVFLFLELVLPPPNDAQHDVHEARLVNLVIFAVYLTASVVAGSAWSIHRVRPLYRWLEHGWPPTEVERRAVVRVPRDQAVLGLVLWEGAAVVFGSVNLFYSPHVAGDVAGTIALAGLSMSALSYLIAERALRPVVALAFANAVPDRPTGIGVLPRILLTWAFCTGIPLLGIALAHIDQPRSALPDLVAPTYFLVGLGLMVGLLGMVFAAKSVAEPLAGVRSAMARVGEGRVDIGVPVDDASEIGMLQAGFNQMVGGLRERQQLVDLFGRHVGVDVAREALERGVRFGGETRHAAVLFVDVVGSTALAASHPPEEIVARLNEFFTVVVGVVERNGGWVNKFEGDAALCVFGVPIERPHPDADALRAARTLRDRLREMSGLDAAIGVAAGTVIAGNVGAEARYEYTVIGDPVNEAARLTELAKSRPDRLLVAADAVQAAGPEEAAHWMIDGETVLRGRAVPTRLAMPLP